MKLTTGLARSINPCRFFAFAKSTRSAEVEDIFEGLKGKIEKKSGFKDWLREITEKLAAQPTGPFYLGGDRPFPHNPSFIPHTPITDVLRNKMYRLNQENPDQWTARKLSAQFKVAIPRIKAILKMKSIEAKMIAEGKLTPDEEHVKRMEEILGARVPVRVEEKVIIDNSIANHLRPMFVVVPETAPPLTFQGAAKLLNRKIVQPKEMESPEAQPRHTPTTTSPHGKFIRFDPYEKSRSLFLFVDMSADQKPSARTLLVREPNGDLRTGHKSERLHVARKVWGRSARHFLG